MSEQENQTPNERLAGLHALDPIALKWRNLIERRRAHFIDLYLSGRWKRYYSQEQFQACFREAMSVADRWSEIVPRQPGEELPKLNIAEITLEDSKPITS